MAIAFSNTIKTNFTFVSDGTRLNLVNQVESALSSSGWNNISGAGTSDWIYESLTTPTGQKIRIEGKDPGSGNCAQFVLKSGHTIPVTGSQIFYLLPVNSAVFRVWANGYQFAVFRSGTDMTTQRSFIMAGCPYLPGFVVPELDTDPWIGWMHGNGNTDVSTTTLVNTFRNAISPGNVVSFCVIWHGITFGATGSTALFGLITQSGGSSSQQDDRWLDGSWVMYEPVLCWSGGLVLSSTTVTRYGQIWDACVIQKTYNSESVRNIGGQIWMVLTHINPTSTGYLKGNLLLLNQ